MRVWVIVTDYFNGEGSSNGVGSVFSSEEKAKDYCSRKNAERVTSYSTSYDYEERTLDVEE
jgi:hypothetical protein